MTQTEPLPRFDRMLPLSGAAFAALMVAGATGFPMPPRGDVSPASSPAWLAAHSSAIIAQTYVRGVASLAFLGLAVAVATAVRRATSQRSSLGAAALVGGSLTAAMLLLAQAVGLSAALASKGGSSAEAVRSLGRLQDAVLNLSSLPAVLLFAGVGFASLRSDLLPRWLTVVTLVGIPFALVDAGSYDGGPLESVGLIGLLYFLVWSLLVGIALRARSPRQPVQPQRHVASASA